MAAPSISQEQTRLIVDEARSWIGTPYQHQTSLKHKGCDCLGLVRGVWRHVYDCEPEQAPAYTPDWAEAARTEQLAGAAARHMIAVPDRKFKTGDLLVFRWRPHVPAKHLAIAVSDNAMVHAQQGSRVCEISISPWWRRHLAFVFAFPPHHRDNQQGRV